MCFWVYELNFWIIIGYPHGEEFRDAPLLQGLSGWL